MKMPISLYIHIPFCLSKCVYCDFASYPDRQADWEGYIDALLDEYQSYHSVIQGRSVPTVFIGGGTPSLLPTELLLKLIHGIRFDEGAEVTMEANPGTVDMEKLRALRGAGVNRLSMGAQAMQDRLLAKIGRIHRAEDIIAAVEMAREASFDNVNLDLMYGLPDQTMEDWRATLDKTIELHPEHISAYSLIVEEGTPLFDAVEHGRTRIPDEETVIEMQRMAVECLARSGYSRYEISNYALKGRECKHNLVYWNRGDYLGLGCAAHSLVNGRRFENARELYGERHMNEQILSPEDAKEETIMLSTRLTKGLSLQKYQADFQEDLLKKYQAPIARLKQWGLVDYDDKHFFLTERGLEVQNAVLVELLENEYT